MNEVNVLESLSQASLSDVSQVLSDHMRSVIKESLLRLMFEEASQLCGGFYHPDKNSKRVRPGSAKGVYTLNGVKENVVRPRVRVSGASSPLGLGQQRKSLINNL
jgi:hypothetical protein